MRSEVSQITQWTVISLNDTTGQVMACVQNEPEPHRAMALTSKEIRASGQFDVQIICAVAGDCVTIMPCEDVSKAAYVADLLMEDEERGVYVCQNCEKSWTLTDLKEVKDYPDVADDDEPAGECPECGALCHEVTACSDCGQMVRSLIGCPDGAEVCQGCFDGGRH